MGARATLRSTSFFQADLSKASFSGADLTGASLETSESRQRRINKIIKRLANKPADTLALVQERRELMEQEAMPAVWGKTSALLALLEMPQRGSAATRKRAPPSPCRGSRLGQTCIG